MKTYYLTVGQKYHTERHPMGLHPDGWVRVEAPSYVAARAAVIGACGQQWAWLYEDEDFDAAKRAAFPLGELAVIRAGEQR